MSAITEHIIRLVVVDIKGMLMVQPAIFTLLLGKGSGGSRWVMRVLSTSAYW